MQLLLLGTAGCHLCELADAIVEHCAQSRGELTIERIDIAEFVHWQTQYATRIPVLYHPETGQDMGWPFDYNDLEQFISELNHV
ncbi:MAG: glutaredoxin family protein [Methylococcaceae bacterium]|nr:glutaredoxin family protein [Methylococcaceae bacterium]